MWEQEPPTRTEKTRAGRPRLRSGCRRARWHRAVQGGGDGAEQLGFADRGRAVGADDVGRGDERALFDGQARRREFVEGGIELGKAASGRLEKPDAVGDELDLGGAFGEGRRRGSVVVA